MSTPRRRASLSALLLTSVAVTALPALLTVGDGTSSAAVLVTPSAAHVIEQKVPNRARPVAGDSRVRIRTRRPVHLQRETATGWVKQTRARTSLSGVVRIVIDRPLSDTRFRLVAPAKVMMWAKGGAAGAPRRKVRLRAWTGRVRMIAGTRTSPTPTPTPTTQLTGTPTKGPTAGPGRTPWVTGYYGAYLWELGEMLAPEDVDMEAMTHFVFGRVAPGGGSLEGEPDDPGFPFEPGELVPGAGTAHDPGRAPDGSGDSVEDYLVGRAHDAGTKALLMLGGDGFDGRGFLLSTGDEVRGEFVDNIVDYLVEHDYDGVDVDWENCLDGEAGCGERPGQRPASATEARRRLLALIGDIRAEAATRDAFAIDPVVITFPGYTLNINYELEDGAAPQWRADVARAVDQYNLMSYGEGTTFNGADWESWFGGALMGANAAHPSDIASSVEAYVAAGVPRDRIGIGIGFYGIYWGPEITGPRQVTNDNEIWETRDVDLGYGALDRMGYLRNGTQHWDEEAKATYRTYGELGAQGYVPPYNPDFELDDDRAPAGFLSYEDPRSIQAKADWVKDTGAGGAIIWTLNYGWVPRTQSNPLLDAVKHAFLDRA